jgi:SAM-dependent methyltransferase
MKHILKRVVRDHFPGLVPIAKDMQGILRATYTKISANGQPAFDCPICRYHGPFRSHSAAHYPIRFTECPRCGLYERHRLQYLTLKELGKRHDLSKMSILHFAPEMHFERFFSGLFAKHETADISAPGVDYHVDIRKLPFADGSYDVIFASHVLEHVTNDHLALAEIKRVLSPNGFAILPVPVVSETTIEYPEENKFEFGHVRAIGADYFQRYEKVFARVEVWKSADFPENNQLYTYEDRSIFPTQQSPLRKPMAGERHPDYVPVCYKASN